jgi:hypothetical protein
LRSEGRIAPDVREAAKQSGRSGFREDAAVPRRMELWFRKIIENVTVYTIAVIIVGLIPIAFLVAKFVLR